MISFRPEDFNREASEQWKSRFGTNPHSQAIQLCLISNGLWAEQKCPTEIFSYYMESGDAGAGEIAKAVEGMQKEPATAKTIRVRTFTPADKGTARGLEAADFVSWHWNKYYMDKMRVGKEDEPRKDFVAFVDSAKGKLESIFLTGPRLKYYFSLVPLD